MVFRVQTQFCYFFNWNEYVQSEVAGTAEKGEPNVFFRFLTAFSLLQNFEFVVSTKKVRWNFTQSIGKCPLSQMGSDRIDCIEGIRAISMTWVIENIWILLIICFFSTEQQFNFNFLLQYNASGGLGPQFSICKELYVQQKRVLRPGTYQSFPY